MRRAKIVCTLGPASATLEMVERLVRAGMDCARLNFSHGDHETHAKTAALVREAARAHPGRVAVGIDARGGRVAVQGWAETTETAAPDLARRFEDAGVAAIIYTDIDRDGALAGPNVAATAALATAVAVPVIASGGIASLDDLRALKSSGAPLDGAISGRAWCTPRAS